MIEVIWQFEVVPNHAVEFERHYSQTGTWAQFFSASPHYLGTRLLRDEAQPMRYLTIDKWVDLASYEAFKSANKTKYQQLDSQMEELTTKETLVGIFEFEEVADA